MGSNGDRSLSRTRGAGSFRAGALILGCILALVSAGPAGMAIGADPIPALLGAVAATATRVTPSDSVDSRGCHALDVWRGTDRVKAIPSSSRACSTIERQERIGDLLYLEWTARWTLVDAKGATGWKRLTELWVTDGTSRGTDRVTTLRTTRGASQAACDSGWGPVAKRPIAFAEWCSSPGSGAWLSGRLVVAWGARQERKPVPRPWQFAIADRRIITTGEDAHGRELWVHDGVMRVVDIRPGPGSSDPHRFRVDGRLVRFVADDGLGPAVWVTDGTRKGTHKVGPVNLAPASHPRAGVTGPRADRRTPS